MNVNTHDWMTGIPISFAARTMLWLTHRLWNRRIASILCAAHADGVIDSRQMHTLASMFDPTQDHIVY